MSSSQTKKTIYIIAPGSFAKPALYSQLKGEILSKGYDAEVVALPSVDEGIGKPPATMEEDAAHIRQIILSHMNHKTKPKDVVLITHSYSGIPGNCALKGLGSADRLAQNEATAVIAYVAMASYLPMEAESIRSIYASYGVELPEPLKSGVPGGYMPVNHKVIAGAVFNDVSDPNLIQEQALHFAAHSSDSFDGKVTYEAWKTIPTLAIVPEMDLLMPLNLQDGMIQRANLGWEVKRSLVNGAGHGLNVTRTSEVVKEILDFAA